LQLVSVIDKIIKATLHKYGKNERIILFRAINEKQTLILL
jgi:hypothetical protein